MEERERRREKVRGQIWPKLAMLVHCLRCCAVRCSEGGFGATAAVDLEGAL